MQPSPLSDLSLSQTSSPLNCKCDIWPRTGEETCLFLHCSVFPSFHLAPPQWRPGWIVRRRRECLRKAARFQCGPPCGLAWMWTCSKLMAFCKTDRHCEAIREMKAWPKRSDLTNWSHQIFSHREFELWHRELIMCQNQKSKFTWSVVPQRQSTSSYWILFFLKGSVSFLVPPYTSSFWFTTPTVMQIQRVSLGLKNLRGQGFWSGLFTDLSHMPRMVPGTWQALDK